MRNTFFMLALFLFGTASVSVYAQSGVTEVTLNGITYQLNVRVAVDASGAPTGNTVSAPGEAMLLKDAHTGNGTTDVYIPSEITVESKVYTVTSIAKDAFKNCKHVALLSIPSTIVAIGPNAFFNISSLTRLECHATIPPAVVAKHFLKNVAVEQLSLVLPAQSIELYLQDDVWKNIVYDATRTDSTNNNHQIAIMTQYLLDDALQKFEEKARVHYEIENGDTVHWHYENHDSTYNEYNEVFYKRTFRNTNWQALYVPLELMYDDWKNKFEVASIDGIVEQDADRDGVYDNFYARATILAEGDSVLPHNLYLIRALNVSAEGGDTIIVSKCSRHDVDQDHLYRVYTNIMDVDTIADGKLTFTAEGSGNVYTFKGQYGMCNVVEKRDAEGNPVQPYCYAMSGGVLKRPNPAMADGVPLGAFRWWLEVTPGSRGASLAANNSRVSFSFGGDNTTPVDEVLINLNEIEELGIYYNLEGRRVDNPGRGIFICNGKKVLLR